MLCVLFFFMFLYIYFIISPSVSLQIVLLLTQYFKALLKSVFLYNSDCWGLNRNQENKINVLQRKLLRNILGINWHKNNWISNDELYEKT